MDFYEAAVGDLALSANTGPSHRSSIDEDFLARFPVSGHSIGPAGFVGLNFSFAAVSVIDDDDGMRFEGPVSGWTRRSNPVNSIQVVTPSDAKCMESY